MKQADRIRSYVNRKIVEPAKVACCTSLQIRAGDVHRAMGLANAYPAVCSALRGVKLESEAGIRLIRQEGPLNGANVWFTYELSPSQPKPKIINRSPKPKVEAHLPADDAINLDRALVLVSCTKTKLPHSASARDLYCSAAFRMKRAIIEREGVEWVILSARDGLVEPSKVVAPYDVELAKMGRSARRDWAQRVLPELIPLAKRFDRVVSLATQPYTEHLLQPLARNGVEVLEPLKGLRRGEQLAWLRAHS